MPENRVPIQYYSLRGTEGKHYFAAGSKKAVREYVGDPRDRKSLASKKGFQLETLSDAIPRYEAKQNTPHFGIYEVTIEAYVKGGVPPNWAYMIGRQEEESPGNRS